MAPPPHSRGDSVPAFFSVIICGCVRSKHTHTHPPEGRCQRRWDNAVCLVAGLGMLGCSGAMPVHERSLTYAVGSMLVLLACLLARLPACRCWGGWCCRLSVSSREFLCVCVYLPVTADAHNGCSFAGNISLPVSPCMQAAMMMMLQWKRQCGVA